MADTNGSGLAHIMNVSRASGMVAVQAECTCAEALQLMTERADIAHATLDEIATSVLDRTIRFGE
jgi:AmiR/NasT family two-component response regulator